LKAVREVIRSDDGTVIGTLTGGTGPPLLLVHGGLLGLSRWSPLWERLATRFQVTALDRRGRGSSGDSPAYDVSREYQLIAADQPGAAVMSLLSDIIGLSPERIAALASQPGTADVLDIASRTLVREADAIAALDLPGLASNVDTPVLMLLGALSPSWAGEVTRTLSSALRGAELVIIPGHGHEGVDTAATEVADELARFFVDA
jgi:pimeloyl-ACP methyl ester carboxylesterase